MVTFWSTFWATFCGVLIAFALSLLGWWIQRWFVHREQKKATKEELTADLEANLKRLRKAIEAIEAIDRNDKIAITYISGELPLTTIDFAIQTGQIRLFSRTFQRHIIELALSYKQYNTALQSCDEFVCSNLALASFSREIRVRHTYLTGVAEKLIEGTQEGLNLIRKE